MASAELDEVALRWTVTTDTGDVVTSRFCIMATGPLSAALTPDFNGLNNFGGDVYHTAHWPHEPVDFTGKRVAVIGTGSSGIQSVPVIAAQAERLYVFQRTPNYSVPAGNRPLTDDDRARIKADYAERRRLSWRSGGGSPHVAHPKLTMEAIPRGAPRRVREALATRRRAVLQDVRRPADRPRRQRRGPEVLRGEGAGRHRRSRRRRPAHPDATIRSAPSESARTPTTFRRSTSRT